MKNNSHYPPVIIIGMHRSGTGMITKVLEALGCFMGKYKQSEQEAVFFLEINNWLLRQCGGAWDHPSPINYLIDNYSVRTLITDYLSHLITTRHIISFLGCVKYFHYRSLANLDIDWGWKDPRNTYTLPIWLDLFPESKVLHIYRNGIDVASSLRQRSKLELEKARKLHTARKRWHLYNIRMKSQAFVGSLNCLDLASAFSLWESYVGRALNNLKNLPNHCLEVKYEDFVSDPLSGIEAIVNFFGFDVRPSSIAKITRMVKGGRANAFHSDRELCDFYETVRESYWMRKLGY